PPGDVSAAAAAALEILRDIKNVEIERYEPAPGIVNLVARVAGGKAGRRLVFNGHLDTFPIGDAWTVPPLGGVLSDGRLYGRGVADMKGGIAGSIVAASILSDCREDWAGEI